MESAISARSRFRGMLDKGAPPDDWDALAAAAMAEAARLRLQAAE